MTAIPIFVYKIKSYGQNYFEFQETKIKYKPSNI